MMIRVGDPGPLAETDWGKSEFPFVPTCPETRQDQFFICRARERGFKFDGCFVVISGWNVIGDLVRDFIGVIKTNCVRYRC